MREYKDFVVAVTIAVALPVLLSGVYFAKTFARKDGASYVSLLEEAHELIVFGEKDIDVENLLDAKNSYEFSVMYASGPENSMNYVISLKNFSCSSIDMQDIEWKLYKFNEHNHKYELYISKRFDKDDLSETLDKDFVISSRQSLNMGETDKYKLSFSVSDAEYKEGKITAKIIAR